MIDADDTLWENNIHFEQGIKDFVALMKENNLHPNGIEKFIRAREIENVPRFGYGSRSMMLSMIEVYKEFCQKEDREEDEAAIVRIKEIGSRVKNYKIEFLPGVEEAIPVLHRHNRLIMVTKGEDDEQMGKVVRSGLVDYFEHVKVVPEKDEEIYQGILREFDLEPESTWMIGNSPRSDINPAKAVGMGTVLIPYHSTWVHEVVSIDKRGRETIILDNFSGLLEYFGS